MAKFKKILATVLSVAMLLSVNSQLLCVTAESSTTDTFIISAKSYAVNSLKETYGGNKVDGENLLTDVELTDSEAKRIAKRYSVLAVEKDVILTGDVAETSDDATIQWNLDAIGVTGAETSVVNANKVKVAIIDSGVSFTGDIFVSESADFVNDGNENPLFDDASGHGTAILELFVPRMMILE